MSQYANLADVPLVVNYGGPHMYKFIVVEVTKGGQKRTVVRIADEVLCTYHRNIFSLLSCELEDTLPGLKNYRVLGGGMVMSRHGKLNLFGNSSEYGKENDRAWTAKVVGEAFGIECAPME